MNLTVGRRLTRVLVLLFAAQTIGCAGHAHLAPTADRSAGEPASEGTTGGAGDATVFDERMTRLADAVRGEFSGDRALETVRFMDQYVRWPGNRGFNASIDYVAAGLESAGYVREDLAAADAALTYRIEEYPMTRPAWEPLGATVSIEGEPEAVLDFTTNRNMLAVNSWSTPAGGVSAVLVDVGDGSTAGYRGKDVRGRMVMADQSVGQLFMEAVQRRGAIGVLGYEMPDYTEPEVHRTSIAFERIPADTTARSWGVALSFDARERLRAALDRGPVRLHVTTGVEWTEPARERTLVADIHGLDHPDERLVFSAHIQEPGANDNASGVGAQLEMARTAAVLAGSGRRPRRSITFLWGQEIASTERYIEQDSDRAKGIRWGISLDMVGEDTEKTGGTFLIEKMPDPSAIWTRGNDRRTEWGALPITADELTPHYFNDFILNRAMEQARTTGWVVGTNPYEGGSDHVPFIRAGVAGLLLWHFTDRFYHTDRDRVDMVSPVTLKNVGVTALVAALTLASADGVTARVVVDETLTAALQRLKDEEALSRAELESGAGSDPSTSLREQQEILSTWARWYDGALAATHDVETGGSSEETRRAIEDARQALARLQDSIRLEG